MQSHPLENDLKHVATHVSTLCSDWKGLRGASLFVTGGTGFFGKWLLESFCYANGELKLGARMLVLTRNPKAFTDQFPHLAQDSSLQFHTGDVSSFDFPQGSFTHVIHAATAVATSLTGQNPLSIRDTMVGGTKRVLDFAKHAGAKRFLFTSSGAVYGKQPHDLKQIPEDFIGVLDPKNPGSIYGLAKREAEALCKDAVIARCFAFVGPHLPLDSGFAIGNFIRDALQPATIRIQGDGTPFRSYLYASDLMIWLWTLLLKGTNGRAYNVGSDQEISIGELAHRIEKILNSKKGVQIAKSPQPDATAERYVPSTARARTELGLTQQISLDEAIQKTAKTLDLKQSFDAHQV